MKTRIKMNFSLEKRIFSTTTWRTTYDGKYGKIKKISDKVNGFFPRLRRCKREARREIVLLRYDFYFIFCSLALKWIMGCVLMLLPAGNSERGKLKNCWGASSRLFLIQFDMKCFLLSTKSYNQPGCVYEWCNHSMKSQTWTLIPREMGSETSLKRLTTFTHSSFSYPHHTPSQTHIRHNHHHIPCIFRSFSSLTLRQCRKKSSREAFTRRGSDFPSFLCDFDGIKRQTACVRWWWCRGWLNKIGFNWQVIGKMLRSTETRNARKNHERKFSMKVFSQRKQKKIEIQMWIHNQKHIICTPLEANHPSFLMSPYSI